MIPNRWHFVFGLREQAEPFSLLHYLCLRSCLEVNRPELLIVHCLHEPWGMWWERVRPALQIERLHASADVPTVALRDPRDEPFLYAHESDFLRLQILADEGGFYADMDSLFLRPPSPSWRAAPCIMGEECSPLADQGIGSLCNAWIGAQPGSRFIRRWLHEMPSHYDGSWSHHSTILPWRLSRRDPAGIKVMPETAFYPFPANREGLRSLFEKNHPIPRKANSIHLWHHLWANRANRGFSDFHAGRVTEAYVAHAPTTYAQAARRFLPADIRPTHRRYAVQRLVSAADTWQYQSRRRLARLRGRA